MPDLLADHRFVGRVDRSRPPRDRQELDMEGFSLLPLSLTPTHSRSLLPPLPRSSNARAVKKAWHSKTRSFWTLQSLGEMYGVKGLAWAVLTLGEAGGQGGAEGKNKNITTNVTEVLILF